jgi:hypothetical protein
MPNIYAELSVTSKRADLQELSKITGLSSAEGHNINDVTRRGVILDYSQWDYKTKSYETYYTEDVSFQLITNFENCMVEFINFIQENCCEVSICFVIANVTDIMPALTINKAMINFAAKLNAEIYFDGEVSTNDQHVVSTNDQHS